MRHSRALAFASLVLASIPGLASAQTAPAPAAVATGGEDQIDLKSGGLLRGRIVSLDPGKEAVILIEGTGESRRVPWDEVAKVTRAPGMAPSAPPPPAGWPVAQAMPEAVDGAPRVHIQSDKPGMQLYVVSSFYEGVDGDGNSVGGANFRPVCLAPCDRVIDGRSGQLFAFGSEISPRSSTFQLIGRGPEVSFDVKAGSTGMRVGGLVMIGLSGAMIVGSVAMFVFGTHTLDVTTSTSQSSSADPALLAAGGGLLGAGLGLAVGGIVMVVKSATKYATVRPGERSQGKVPSFSPRLGPSSVLLTF